MPDRSAYRHRTEAVRDEARSRLRALRAERLSRRAAASSPAVEEAPAPAAFAPGADPVMAVSRAASAVTSGMAAAEIAPAGEDAPDAPCPEPRPEMGEGGAAPLPLGGDVAAAGEAWAEDAADPADGEDAPASPASAAAHPPEAEPGVAAESVTPACADRSASEAADAVAIDAPVAALSASEDGAVQRGVGGSDAGPGSGSAAADAPETSDLLRLPGAGSGLVWMLGQCGISSLEALGRADPQELAGRLGLVGQMIDLEGWIAFARNETGDREPSGPSGTRV